MPRAFVLLNPAAGTIEPSRIRRALQLTLGAAGWSLDVHETQEGGPSTEVVRSALESAPDVVIAAGGDGTVAEAASAIGGEATPLAIVPGGSGNVLARELGIPTDPQEALQLVTGDHDIKELDALAFNKRYALLAISAGVSASIMRLAPQEEKRRLGRWAYARAANEALAGLQPSTFSLRIDGRWLRVSASDVHVVNVGAAGDPAIRWSQDVLPDDGQAEVCIMRAQTLPDLGRAAINMVMGLQEREPGLCIIPARREVEIIAAEPVPCQADGDYVGQTPMRLQIVPGAVRLVVPLGRA